MAAAGIARIAETVATIRGSLDGFDIAVAARPGADLDALQAAGATWAVCEFWPGDRPDQVLQAIERRRPA